MIIFFIIGCFITLSAGCLVVIHLINDQQLMFGPFIATLIGLNYLFIAYQYMKQEKEEKRTVGNINSENK